MSTLTNVKTKSKKSLVIVLATLLLGLSGFTTFAESGSAVQLKATTAEVPANQNVAVGEINVPVYGFYLEASNEDVMVKKIELGYRSNSKSKNELNIIKLVDEANIQYGTIAFSGEPIIFITNFTVKKGEKKKFTVYADISPSPIAEPGEKFALYIKSIKAFGASSAYYVKNTGIAMGSTNTISTFIAE